MGHTAVSATLASAVTLKIGQHGVKKNKKNYCNFASFNRVVDVKTSILYMGPNIINVG